MKSLKSKVKKAAKKKALRKDFEKRKRINANVPTVKEKVEVQGVKQKTKFGVPVFEFLVNEKGQKVRRQVMEGGAKKEITVKTKAHKLFVGGDKSRPKVQQLGQRREAGMIEYPKQRKFREKKLKTNK